MKQQTTSALLITLAALCFLLPKAQAVSPPPDGAYPKFNTAEGQNALLNLDTTAGPANTAIGWYALFSDVSAGFNTGVGGGALALNNGDSNTAVGAGAMLLNTSGADNVAIGTNALIFNDSGSGNTVTGGFALSSNTTGGANTVNGQSALLDNTSGSDNTAVGIAALQQNTTGSGNIALGALAGLNQTTGGNNIYIETLVSPASLTRLPSGIVLPELVIHRFLSGLFMA